MERFEVGHVAVEPGTRSDALLKVGALPDGTVVGIPMIIIHGAKAGPVLYLNSGTHGDEPEGAVAIIDAAAELDPATLRGTFVGIPVLNVGAFMAKASIDVSGTRENPVDWKNLARAFPGRADDEYVAVLIKGIRNVLRHLGMVEGGGAAEVEEVVGDRKCIESETYIYADATGILRVKVKIGQEIKKGELLGVIQDFYGGTKQELRSPLDGIVTGVRTKPMVWVGEPAFLVANFIEEGAVGPTKARTDVTPP